MVSKTDLWHKLKRKSVYISVIIMVAAAVVTSSITYFLTRQTQLYPLDFEANFLAACINSGDSAYGCICPLRYFEQHISFKQAQSIDVQAKKTGKLPRNLQQVFNDCAKHKA